MIFYKSSVRVWPSLVALIFITLALTSVALSQSEIDWSRYEFSKTKSYEDPSSAAYIVKFLGKKAELNELGIKVLKKLDRSHFIVSQLSIEDTAIFGSVARANNLWKLGDKLYKRQGGTIFSSERLTITITEEMAFIKDMQQADINFSVFKKYKDVWKINLLEYVKVNKILLTPSILSINLTSNNVKEETPLRDFNYNVNQINLLRHEESQLNGAGQVVSLMEKSYDVQDMDFKGRHIESDLRPSEISEHSTEMATIVAGAGNSSFQGQGIAWGANLTSSDFSGTLPDNDSDYTDLGVSVQNHSYGTIPENFYGPEARAYDLSANSNPELLHVFSAGNNGLFTNENGTYSGIKETANLTGNFKMAKNILTVGGVDTVTIIVKDLSKGPAYDGRVKPELVAYSLTGSSSSAAIVSGIALLLQQGYRENHEVMPESALLKAVLINSADDVGPHGIDFLSGYGNVNAYRAWKTLSDGRFFSGHVGENEKVSFSISVPENAVNLKVSLVWNDPAADVNAATALVNDLDLQLIGVSSHYIYLPWVLSSAPNIDSLTLPAKRKVDRLNNVEQVSIANPEDRNYRIEVSGFSVESGEQPFFLAYEWDIINTFKWTFPSGSDNMPQDGEFQSFFRWQSTITNETGHLQYSIDQGVNWITIDDNVDLYRNHYSWKPPNYSGIARARMITSDNIFETDDFVISRPLAADVGFNCVDSLLLTWPKLDNATKYIVSSPGEKYLETVIESSDTVIVMNKLQFPQSDFTVTPVFDKKSGLRNLTFDYTLRGSGCYIMNFFTNLNSDIGVDLSLALGTTYQVGSVSFEKLANDRFVTLYKVDDPKTSEVFHTDTTAQDGLNVYRANVEFISGSNIYSRIDTVRFLKTTTAVLFPNPAERFNGLNILLKDFNGKDAFFHLFNSNGELLLVKKLESERDQVLLNSYRKGLYFYEIVSGNNRQTGRLMIK